MQDRFERLCELYTRVACTDHHKSGDMYYSIRRSICAYPSSDEGWYVEHDGYVDEWHLGPYQTQEEALQAGCVKLVGLIRKHIMAARTACLDWTPPTPETCDAVEADLQAL